MADAAGIHPISLGPLPDPIAKLLNMQVSVQQLAVEAAVHASKEIALQALLIDPVVNSASAAVKVLDELWDAEPGLYSALRLSAPSRRLINNGQKIRSLTTETDFFGRRRRRAVFELYRMQLPNGNQLLQ